MQVRIVEATKVRRWNKVKALQRLLTNSFHAKALAVKRVTENQGKRTAGIDNVLWSTPESKFEAIGKLKRNGYHPKPLRRIYIPKSNGKLRPLSIPTMHDRAMQALHLLALDPVSETISDGQSYGFRKSRSTHDAIGQCFLNHRYWGNPKDKLKRKSAEWVLEGDIKGCFDNISHQWLLDNVPMDKEMLRKWLKCGYFEGSARFPTEQGTPQGGIISPVLANFTLNGLEKHLRTLFKSDREFEKINKVHLVRYADDFVITGITKDLLELVIKPAVEQFLKIRGLELSPEKTKITHIMEGYDFLGQNVRRYDKKLLIKPSTKNVKTFLDKIRKTIVELRPAKQETVIQLLNPVIRGWAMYHKGVVASRIFQKVDTQIWAALWRWAKRRHPNKSTKWIKYRYFHKVGNRNWTFAVKQITVDKDGNKQASFYELSRASSVHIKRHEKIKANANPYDPKDEQYFEKRDFKKSLESLTGRKRQTKLFMDQDGKCVYCGALLGYNDVLHRHHLVEKHRGGSDALSNLVLLHDICHTQVHSKGLKLQKPAPPKRGFQKA